MESEVKEERELEKQLQPPFHVPDLPIINPNIHQTAASSKKYYLSSPNVGQYRRSHSVISSPSSDRRVASATPNDLEFRSLWEEDKELHNIVEQEPPSSSSPSLHMQELLSQLSSSISTMSTAFTQVQASLNTYHIVGHESMSDVEKAMIAQEFQRLLDLEIGLHSLLQQYGMEEEQCREKSESKCNYGATNMDDYSKNVQLEKKNAMLESYEGIITRFLDEIRRKDAVAHALKETLAKSLLRGEKLERRMKALEVKKSPAP